MMLTAPSPGPPEASEPLLAAHGVPLPDLHAAHLSLSRRMATGQRTSSTGYLSDAHLNLRVCAHHIPSSAQHSSASVARHEIPPFLSVLMCQSPVLLKRTPVPLTSSPVDSSSTVMTESCMPRSLMKLCTLSAHSSSFFHSTRHCRRPLSSHLALPAKPSWLRHLNLSKLKEKSSQHAPYVSSSELCKICLTKQSDALGSLRAVSCCTRFRVSRYQECTSAHKLSQEQQPCILVETTYAWPHCFRTV